MTTTKLFFATLVLTLSVPACALGQTWEYIGHSDHIISALYLKNNTIYAGTGGGPGSQAFLFKSTDQGANWDTLAAGTYEAVESIISIEDTLFFGTHRMEFYRSTDNGNSWQEKANGLPGELAMPHLVLDGNSNLIVGGDWFDSTGLYNGIFRSNDHAETWDDTINNGILGSFQRLVMLQVNQQGHIFAATRGSGTTYGALWRSTDNALSWDELNNGLPYSVYSSRCLAINSGGDLFFGYGDTLYYSIDNGDSWSSVYTFSNSVNAIKCDTVRGIIYAQIQNTIYRSFDNGANWADIGAGLPDLSPQSSMVIDVGGNVYLGTMEGVYMLENTISAGPDATICFGDSAYLSGSGGIAYSWNPTVGLSCSSCREPKASPSITTDYVLTAAIGSGSETDTVRVIVNPLPSVSFSGLDTSYCTVDPAVTLSGSPPGGIFNGPGIDMNQFEPFNAGVGNHNINYVYTDGNNCTDSSSQVVTVNACTGTGAISLIKNVSLFPNPSGGIFTLELFISEQEDININITDILGQEVLSGTWKQYRGNFKEEIDISGHKTGIYLLKIKSHKATMHKKIIVK